MRCGIKSCFYCYDQKRLTRISVETFTTTCSLCCHLTLLSRSHLTSFTYYSHSQCLQQLCISISTECTHFLLTQFQQQGVSTSTKNSHKNFSPALTVYCFKGLIQSKIQKDSLTTNICDGSLHLSFKCMSLK